MQGFMSVRSNINTSHDQLTSFEVDHLMSFVGSRNMEMDPQLAIARLGQRQESAGIITIRCQLVLVNKNGIKEMLVMNKQTREVMEEFPLPVISNIYHQSTSDRNESYNRKIIIILSHSPYAAPDERNCPEMHIFQSIFLPAANVVERILQFKNDDSRRGLLSRQESSATTYVHNNEIHAFANLLPQKSPGPILRPPSTAQLENSYSYFPSQRSVTRSFLDPIRVDKEIYLLNRCFDAVEAFVLKVNDVVKRYSQEKTSSVRSKAKSQRSKKGTVNQTLLRDFPGRLEFIECFKLIKLSLVLLGRLKDAIIGSPTVAEIVNSLFQTLEVITNASRDPASKIPTLARGVVSPLLLRDSIKILESTLNEQQRQFWLELGDTWTIPREEWRGGFIPSYVPTFNDGFTPSTWDYDEAIFVHANRDERTQSPAAQF